MPAIVALKLISVKKESENLYRATTRGLEYLRFYHGLRWLLAGKDFDFMVINILTRLKKDSQPYYGCFYKSLNLLYILPLIDQNSFEPFLKYRRHKLQ